MPKVMYAHPVHQKMIHGLLNPTNGLPPIYGVEVRFNDAMAKYVSKWVFPEDRFWQYEPSDEKWCRQLGIGGEVETAEPLIYIMDVPSPKDWLNRAMGTFSG